MTGGMTISLPQEDKNMNSKSEMLDDIVSLLGGRIAEKLVLNDISTGASNDLERATAIAKAMVTRYGMSDALGPVVYDTSGGEVFIGRDYGHVKSYSEKTSAEIDDEIRSIVEEAYKRCEDILNSHMDILHLTADYLLKNEVMDGETFAYVFAHRELPKEPLKAGKEAARQKERENPDLPPDMGEEKPLSADDKWVDPFDDGGKGK
jgi:cell division protease FtsH